MFQLVYLPQNRRVFGSPMIQVDVLKDTLRSFISPPALMAKYALSSPVCCEIVAHRVIFLHCSSICVGCVFLGV